MATYSKDNGQLIKIAGTTTINQERPAATVSFDNKDTGLSANNVQNAISEINSNLQDCFQSVSDGKAKIASAITDQGITTASDAEFGLMAANVKQAATNKYESGVTKGQNDVKNSPNSYSLYTKTQYDTVSTNLSNLTQSVNTGKASIASAITEKGVATTASATFDTMATNISNISTGMAGAVLTSMSWNIHSHYAGICEFSQTSYYNISKCKKINFSASANGQSSQTYAQYYNGSSWVGMPSTLDNSNGTYTQMRIIVAYSRSVSTDNEWDIYGNGSCSISAS